MTKESLSILKASPLCYLLRLLSRSVIPACFDHKEVDYRPQKGRFSSPARGFPARSYLTIPTTTNSFGLQGHRPRLPDGSPIPSHHRAGRAGPLAQNHPGPESRPGQDTNHIHNPTGHQGPHRPVQVTKAPTGQYRSPRPPQASTGHQGPHRPVQVTKARKPVQVPHHQEESLNLDGQPTLCYLLWLLSRPVIRIHFDRKSAFDCIFLTAKMLLASFY